MSLVFGYIRPRKSELLVREYEQYRAVYCSLCKQMGKSYGPLSRLALSYDGTFYALLGMALEDSPPLCFHTGKCVVNPLKKCNFCTGGEDMLHCAAALSVILAYYKGKDDLSDSRLLGRIRAAFLLPWLLRRYKRAARDYPALERAAGKAIRRQQELEKGEFPGLDACAEPTAEMLAEIFSTLPGNPAQKRILRQVGYFTGRWVYLIDAADDLERDCRDGAFNPFLLSLRLDAQSPPEALAKARAYANEALNMTLSQALSAFQLLDLPRFGSILNNILRLGLPEMQKESLFSKEKEEHVGSV